jgi:enoyl-CoA hydratase/carnithine racemase
VGGGASVRVPKLIGMARTQDMMFTGSVISAEEEMLSAFRNTSPKTEKDLTKDSRLHRKLHQIQA